MKVSVSTSDGARGFRSGSRQVSRGTLPEETSAGAPISRSHLDVRVLKAEKSVSETNISGLVGLPSSSSKLPANGLTTVDKSQNLGVDSKNFGNRLPVSKKFGSSSIISARAVPSKLPLVKSESQASLALQSKLTSLPSLTSSKSQKYLSQSSGLPAIATTTIVAESETVTTKGPWKYARNNFKEQHANRQKGKVILYPEDLKRKQEYDTNSESSLSASLDSIEETVSVLSSIGIPALKSLKRGLSFIENLTASPEILTLCEKERERKLKIQFLEDFIKVETISAFSDTSDLIKSVDVNIKLVQRLEEAQTFQMLYNVFQHFETSADPFLNHQALRQIMSVMEKCTDDSDVKSSMQRAIAMLSRNDLIAIKGAVGHLARLSKELGNHYVYGIAHAFAPALFKQTHSRMTDYEKPDIIREMVMEIKSARAIKSFNAMIPDPNITPRSLSSKSGSLGDSMRAVNSDAEKESDSNPSDSISKDSSLESLANLAPERPRVAKSFVQQPGLILSQRGLPRQESHTPSPKTQIALSRVVRPLLPKINSFISIDALEESTETSQVAGQLANQLLVSSPNFLTNSIDDPLFYFPEDYTFTDLKEFAKTIIAEALVLSSSSVCLLYMIKDYDTLFAYNSVSQQQKVRTI